VHPHGGFLHARVHPLYHTAAAFLLDHVVDALFEALVAGLIECFGSRHSAHFPRAEVPPLSPLTVIRDSPFCQAENARRHRLWMAEFS
jgi:hypothetical protein